jgi:hypothetical protein
LSGIWADIGCGIWADIECGIWADIGCGIWADIECGIWADIGCGIWADIECGIWADIGCGIWADIGCGIWADIGCGIWAESRQVLFPGQGMRDMQDVYTCARVMHGRFCDVSDNVHLPTTIDGMSMVKAWRHAQIGQKVAGKNTSSTSLHTYPYMSL